MTQGVALTGGVFCFAFFDREGFLYGLYPFFSLLKIQPSGTAFAPAKSYTFKR